MGIFDFFKKKNKYNEEFSALPPEGNYLIDTDDGILSLDSEGFNQMRENFHDSIGEMVVSHLEKIKGLVNNDSAHEPLDEAIDLVDDIKIAVLNKMPACLEDGRGHSIGLGSPDGEILISVSCWPCSLRELRDHFENQFGEYIYALNSYVENALAQGFSTFIHLFYCYTQIETGVTATFFDTRSGVFFKPDELIDDEELQRFM